MGKFRQGLFRFMYGRYGSDKLSKFITYFSIFLMIAGLVVAVIWPQYYVVGLISSITYLVAWLLVIWNFFRMMSRNISKRRRENERYIKMMRAIKRFFSGNTSSGTKTQNYDNATYVFRDCTKCGSTLRLPRKEGKHKVKCPRCSHSFKVKVKK